METAPPGPEPDRIEETSSNVVPKWPSPAKRASFVMIALVLAALVFVLRLPSKVPRVENLHPGFHVKMVRIFHKGTNTVYDCNEVERYWRIAVSKIGLPIKPPQKIGEALLRNDESSLFLTYSCDFTNADLEAIRGELVDNLGRVSPRRCHAWCYGPSFAVHKKYALFCDCYPVPSPPSPQETNGLNYRLRLKLGTNAIPVCEIIVGIPPSRYTNVPQRK